MRTRVLVLGAAPAAHLCISSDCHSCFLPLPIVLSLHSHPLHQIQRYTVSQVYSFIQHTLPPPLHPFLDHFTGLCWGIDVVLSSGPAPFWTPS